MKRARTEGESEADALSASNALGEGEELFSLRAAAALAGHAAVKLAGRAEVLVTLAKGHGCDVSLATLPELLIEAASGGPFSPRAMLHALCVLGEAGDADANPPPQDDPDRTWLTLFSEVRWYPRLHVMAPDALRAVQEAAAFLNVPKDASDRIIGAVCAQRWANVPAGFLRVLGLESMDDVLHDRHFTSLTDVGGEISSLFFQARAYYDEALAPFRDHVVPRIQRLTLWNFHDWPGIVDSYDCWDGLDFFHGYPVSVCV